ncbi:MAG: DUF885 domain-containing protein [Oscillospiraceae bacterium]|jgi:uncharacterized protein (DUF885 family)|nr:DUF885 domain-containing protein [Oscillospiraceae bacterium]
MIKKILSLILTFCIFITPIDITSANAEDNEFIRLTDTFFQNYTYLSGGLTQHSMFELPEEYSATLIKGEEEAFKGLIETFLSDLETIDIEKLSEDNQYRYKNIQTAADRELKIIAHPDELYEPLAANGGEQVLLIINLCLYEFNNQTDIENYFEIIKTIPEYFDDIIALEKKRFANGYFMTGYNADTVMAFCEDLINSGENNPLLTSFKTRINEWGILEAKTAEDLIEQNLQAVNDYILPSYQALYDYIDMFSYNYDGQPLGHKDEGKAFFRDYAQEQVGTDKTVEEMKNLLQEEYSKLIKKLDVYEQDKDFQKKLEETVDNVSYPSGLQDLAAWAIEKTNQNGDFPKLNNISYSIEELDIFFRDYINPAFILVPPVDNPENFRVLSNGVSDLATICHEVAPGHLWQLLYHSRNDLENIDYYTFTLGFVEGWAQYAQEYSLDFAFNDSDVKEYIKLYDKALLYEIALSDIYVNYDGMTAYELSQKNRGNGAYYYNALYSSPCSFLVYAMGQYFIDDMKKEASTYLGADFNTLNFNTFLLQNSYLNFNLLKERFYLDYLGLSVIPKFPLTSDSKSQTAISTQPPDTTKKITTTTENVVLATVEDKKSFELDDNMILAVCTISTLALVIVCGFLLLRNKKND